MGQLWHYLITVPVELGPKEWFMTVGPVTSFVTRLVVCLPSLNSLNTFRTTCPPFVVRLE